MRTVKDPDIRKKEIIDAAMQVFSGKGYDKTSISDIAKEAGISQGLCYRYFASKEEIYDAAIEEYAEYIVQNNLEHFRHQEMNLKAQIRLLSGKTLDYEQTEQENSDFYQLFHKEGNQKMHEQLMWKVAEKLIPYLTEILLVAKTKGEIHIVDAEGAAHFLIYGQVGMLLHENTAQTERIQNCMIELLGL